MSVLKAWRKKDMFSFIGHSVRGYMAYEDDKGLLYCVCTYMIYLIGLEGWVWWRYIDLCVGGDTTITAWTFLTSDLLEMILRGKFYVLIEYSNVCCRWPISKRVIKWSGWERNRSFMEPRLKQIKNELYFILLSQNKGALMYWHILRMIQGLVFWRPGAVRLGSF